MSLYTITIHFHARKDKDAWDYVKLLRTEVPDQLNSLTLLKDGKEYPQSKSDFDLRDAQNWFAQRRALTERMEELTRELDKVRKEVTELNAKTLPIKS